MQNLTDRDMGYDMLYGTKSSAMTYMDAVLESANPRCREIFHRLHDDALRSQYKLWQFLHQRQEYRIQQAERQEIDGVHQRMAHLCRTHEIGAHQAAGTAADGGRWEAENRAPAAYGAGRWTDARNGGGWDEREGRWSDGGSNYGHEPAYGASGSIHGSPSAGNYVGAGAPAGITFEPDHNMPEGTRFESDRGFAEGNQYATTAGASAGAGYGGPAPSSHFSGAGASGTFSGAAAAPMAGPYGGRHNDAGRGMAGNAGASGGSAWNSRESGRTGSGGRAGGVTIGAGPSEGGRRNFGENTWSSEETRKSGRY